MVQTAIAADELNFIVIYRLLFQMIKQEGTQFFSRTCGSIHNFVHRVATALKAGSKSAFNEATAEIIPHLHDGSYDALQNDSREEHSKKQDTSVFSVL